MKIQNILWPALSLGLAISVGLLIGQSSDQKEQDTYYTIKSYKLPVNRVSEARSKLANLFDRGSVQKTGDGTLMVRMPKSYEAGVDKIIKKFQESSGYEGHKIQMDYWVLRASSENIANSGELNTLKDVIAGIKEKEGPLHFQLLEHLSTHSLIGRGSEIHGWLSKIESNIMASREGEYSMNLKFDSQLGRIEASTEISDGEFIVLGQSAANVRKLKKVIKATTGKEPELNGINNIFFIVRAKKDV